MWVLSLFIQFLLIFISLIFLQLQFKYFIFNVNFVCAYISFFRFNFSTLYCKQVLTLCISIIFVFRCYISVLNCCHWSGLQSGSRNVWLLDVICLVFNNKQLPHALRSAVYVQFFGPYKLLILIILNILLTSINHIIK